MANIYDELANEFDERYRRQSFPGIQAWLRRLAGYPGTNKVLEVGCGTGHWLNVLSDLPVELTGVDPSRAMLEKARARATKAALVCASAENIPFPASSFDLIFCVNAFHHFSDPKKFLRVAEYCSERAAGSQFLVLIPMPQGPTGISTTTSRVLGQQI
jgi:ubiquinone/menaquinone biosynthesis C-methylase UbiE